MISKLVENSVLYASKLNEPSQWISKHENPVEICSKQFTNILLENVKDKNVAKCMISICVTLIPSIPKFSREADKLNILVTPIISSLITPNFKSPLRCSLMGQIASYCLDKIIKLNLTSNKLWKRELWETFFDNSFLWMPHYYFLVLSDAFRLILQEPDRFPEVLSTSMS